MQHLVLIEEDTMNWLAKLAWIMLCATVAITTSAQTLTTLTIFHRWSGDNPEAALTQGSDGNLYGTLASDGHFGVGGAVFRISPSGERTVLHHFCAERACADGARPYARLVEGSDGNFYGTTLEGGTGPCYQGIIDGCGIVFRITTHGKFTKLHNICTLQNCVGAYPGALVQASNGKFFGTTCWGGASNNGTVFVITAQGMKRLHSFNGVDGMCPAALVQSADGNFYGTTVSGGAYSLGTVFKITPQGGLTTVYSFCAIELCADGSYPNGGVTLATNGSLYGVTSSGGLSGEGTVFEITSQGSLKTVYSFCVLGPDCSDGAGPRGPLIQASDGHFYGTTANGGSNDNGTIFKISLAGSLTTVHSFCLICGEAASPQAGLIQARDGRIYGTTTSGPGRGAGTVFALGASSGDW